MTPEELLERWWQLAASAGKQVRAKMSNVQFSIFNFQFATAFLAAIPNLYPPRGLLQPGPWELHRWQLLELVLALLLAFGLLLWRWRRPKPVIPTPPSTVANRRLAALRQHPEDRKLYAEVAQILRQYALATAKLAPQELTTEEFRREFTRTPLGSPEVSAALLQLLGECDESRFALSPSPPSAGIVARAAAWLGQVEACLNPPTPPQIPAPASATA